MTENTRITEEGYDRDARHYEFELENTGLTYEVGDVLSVQANNQPDQVSEFLEMIKIKGDEVISI